MPSRKQRRRRQKSRRHEYEYVLVDEAGTELEVVEPESKAKSGKGDRKRPAQRGRGRPIREVQPPSWNRVGRRAAIFAPLMFAVVYLLGGSQVSLAGKLAETVFLLAFFLPFSYVMDSIAYRAYRKRVDRDAGSRSPEWKWPAPGHGARSSRILAPSSLRTE